MGLWDKLLGKNNKEEPEAKSESLPTANASEPKIRFEDIPDTLNLGWYWSEKKQEHQMAKIAEKDRATHFYVIGATGSGKTKFLEFLIQQDIEKGNGFGVIDPHGDLIEDIKGFLACHKDENGLSERVILIDPTDTHSTVTFNPLEKLPNVSISEQANELISAFRKIWADSWGVRMEDLMRNSLIALGEAELTLIELPQFLTRRDFRETVLEKVMHPMAREYFRRFNVLTDRGQITWIEPVMNKINAFFSDERIRQMFSSPQSSFNLRKIMDQRKMLLVKLDKGKLKDSADLLGSLLMAKIQMAAFSRSDLPRSKRTPFYLYIDEFQNFASESFQVVLSEARKYGLSLIMAHQTLSQIPDELRSLILGNTGIQVYFRVNRQDASLLAKEAFEYSGYEVKTISPYGQAKYWSLGEEWEHKTEEFQSLPPRFCYVKHKIEGGIISLQTVEIEPAWEVLGMQEQKYCQFLQELPFGRKYLVSREELRSLADERQIIPKKENEKPSEEEKVISSPRKETGKVKVREAAISQEANLTAEEMFLIDFISKNPNTFVTNIYKALNLSGYKGDRLKENLLEKELIAQEETREGRGGRLAKILLLTVKGATLLKKTPVPGKGGDMHKHLQMTIKEQAELFGWKAVIEERIPKSLESVDVGLSRDDVRLAIEICSNH